MKRIGIVKFGKAILFDESRWGNIGGNDEVPMLIHALAHAYPGHEFWLIGPNDLGENRSRVPENVRSAYSLMDRHDQGLTGPEHKRIGEDPGVDEKAAWHQDAVRRVLEKNGIELDAVIAYCGIVSTNNLLFNRRKQDGSGWSKPQYVTCRYVSQPLKYIMESGVPWINVITDPRQIANVKDWERNPPRAEYSQTEKTLEYKPGPYVFGPDDIREIQKTRVLKYAPVETLGLLSRRRSGKTPVDKEPGLTIVMHEGGGENCESRGPLLKEYVLDHVDDVQVFGRWSDEWLEDSRFKGPVPAEEVQNKLSTRRYTFVIPIAPGWSTLKFYEMVAAGVIPFLHPSYASDIENPVIPEFLWVKDAADLQRKMEKLDSDPAVLAAAWKKCLQAVPDSMFTGSEQVEMFRSILKDDCGVDLGEPSDLNKHLLDIISEHEKSNQTTLDNWF